MNLCPLIILPTTWGYPPIDHFGWKCRDTLLNQIGSAFASRWFRCLIKMVICSKWSRVSPSQDRRTSHRQLVLHSRCLRRGKLRTSPKQFRLEVDLKLVWSDKTVFLFSAHFIKVLSLSVLDKVLAVLEDPQLLGVEVPSHLAKGGTLLQPEKNVDI